MRYLIIIISFCLSINDVCAQKLGWGAVLRTELYNNYANPPDGIASRSAGSALLNLGVGPKIWIGGGDFSFSPEASVMFSPFALSLGDNKGLGSLSFPIMGKFEFLGNSNFNRDGKWGFGIGGGIQFNRTELWGLKDSFQEQGVQRNYFKTYIVEGDIGFGLSGFDLHLYVRYGWNKEIDARTWNIGMGWNFNVPCLIEAANSEF